MSEILNAFINIVHTQSNTSFTLKFENFHSLLFSLIISENNLESSRFVNSKISGFILITKGMSSNDNGFFPSRN
jgi:hypothetical protein